MAKPHHTPLSAVALVNRSVAKTPLSRRTGPTSRLSGYSRVDLADALNGLTEGVTDEQACDQRQPYTSLSSSATDSGIPSPVSPLTRAWHVSTLEPAYLMRSHRPFARRAYDQASERGQNCGCSTAYFDSSIMIQLRSRLDAQTLKHWLGGRESGYRLQRSRTILARCPAATVTTSAGAVVARFARARRSSASPPCADDTPSPEITAVTAITDPTTRTNRESPE